MSPESPFYVIGVLSLGLLLLLGMAWALERLVQAVAALPARIARWWKLRAIVRRLERNRAERIAESLELAARLNPFRRENRTDFPKHPNPSPRP